ncbi:pro-epidermal growth factor-like isoform X2 [Physella acuta]|nr:pro-epidermal growth factor-like isoform X2 [Physella acuta]
MRVTMREAQNICLANNGSLVTITSQDESDYIFSQYRAINYHAWIGLTDEQQEGEWKWLDGAPYTFTLWGYGEPGGGLSENCALLRYADWVDTSCFEQWSFICEMVIFIDECANATLNDCQQACTDTYESYTCSCFEGYLSQVVDGQVMCKDIDECSNKTLNGCQQNCSNTDGGYRCTCFIGHKNYTVDGQVMCEG